MKNFLKISMLAASLFAVTQAHAAMRESFEPYTDWSWVETNKWEAGTWYGMAHVEHLTNAIAAPVGFPIAETNHNATLCVYGDVFAENPAPATPNGAAQVEYLQQVNITDDQLGDYGFEDDVQIALATGKVVEDDPEFVHLWLLCTPKGTNAKEWINIGKVELDTYMRVNLAFDYTNKSCRVSVNGIPKMSANGYLLPDCEDAAGVGAWYRLASVKQVEKVSSVQFIGVNTKWEDLVITETPFKNYAPFPTNVETRVNVAAADVDPKETPAWMNVAMNDLNRWAIDNVVDTKSIRLDKSGHTVKEKLELGYDPLDGKKFAPTNMSMQVKADGTERVTLAFPQAQLADDLRYRIIATGTHDDGAAFREVLSAERTDIDDATRATGELPTDAPRVLFFQLEAERTNLTSD